MSEESKGLGQRAKGLVDQAKRGVGAGGPPTAEDVGGRIGVVREALRAFGEGDIDRYLEAFDEEVEWSGPKGGKFPGAGNHAGRDAVRDAFVKDAERSYASFGFRPDRYLESQAEDFVVVIGAFTGEGVKGSGVLDAPAVQVWGFDGETVISVGIYTDSEEFSGVVTEKEQEESEREDDEDDGDGDGKDESTKDKSESESKGESGGEGESGDKSDSEDKSGSREKAGSRDQGESPARQGEDQDDEGDDDTDDSDTKESERTT